MRAVALLALAVCALAPAGAELLVAATAAGRAPATTRLAAKQARKAHARAFAAGEGCVPSRVTKEGRATEETAREEGGGGGRPEVALAPTAGREERPGGESGAVSRRLFEAIEDSGAGPGGATKAVQADLSAAMLPNAPADIDLDCELEDETAGDAAASRGAGEAATAAAERARLMAQKGLLALSLRWSMCMEQARQVASACRFENVEGSMRSLAGAASRLVPPTPARRGLQTFVTESTSLWVGALWKILMLQVLVILKTVVSQGNVIARSFIQAACLEPTAMVPDSPMLQRQRSRTKAAAVKAEVEAARARMLELQRQMSKTAETLRTAELASSAHFAQVSEGTCSQWSEGEHVQVGGGGSWWEQQKDKRVSFQGSSGSLPPASRRIGSRVTPLTHGRQDRSSTPSQALLMSASRRTPLPASPLPPRTPVVD